MPELYATGLKSISIGDPVADGGIATAWTALGTILQDTATFVTESGEETPFYGEASDDPFLLKQSKGISALKFSVVDFEPTAMAAILGGSVTGTGATRQYEAPLAAVNIEKSVKVVNEYNHELSIVRGKVNAVVNAKLAKKGISQIDVTVKVLTPKKAATAPWTFAPKA